MKKFTLIIMVFCIPFIGISQEVTTQSDKWEWDITPYLWAVGMKGDLSVSDQTDKIDVGFTDILKNIKIGGMLHAEARKGRWAIMADFLYAKLKQDIKNPGGNNDILVGSELDLKIEQTLIELGGAYTFAKVNSFKLEVIFGARYFDLSTDIKGVDGISSVFSHFEENFIDPFVGLRFVNYWNKFGLLGRFDFGGFGVGSEISYKYNLGVGYKFSRLFELMLAYEAYNPFYDNGENFVYDVSTEGFLLGFKFQI